MAAGSPLPQVLAVGDSPQPSGLHRGLLGRDGYRDSTAADAEPAEIGRQRPDAIVLDGRWEGIEAGPSLLGRLEADPVPAEILPLVLSFAGRGHRRLAADLATRDIAVAPKPVAPADLRPGVRVALPPDAGRAAPGPTPTPRTVPPPRQPAGFFAGVSRGAAVAEEAFRVRVEAILAGGGIGTEPWSPPDAGDVSEDHEDAADPPRGGALGSGRRRRRLPAGRKECASMSRIATADQAHPIDRRPPAGWGASATNPDPPKLPQPDAQPAQKVPKPPKPRKKEKRRPGRKG